MQTTTTKKVQYQAENAAAVNAASTTNTTTESKVIDLAIRRAPFDRLPTRSYVGQPPEACLYHTQRAEDARQRAAAELPAWVGRCPQDAH